MPIESSDGFDIKITTKRGKTMHDQTKSVLQEFLDSVQNDTSLNLAIRLVRIKRAIERKERLMRKRLPVFGCIATKCKHAEIIRNEILRRIRQSR